MSRRERQANDCCAALRWGARPEVEVAAEEAVAEGVAEAVAPQHRWHGEEVLGALVG